MADIPISARPSHASSICFPVNVLNSSIILIAANALFLVIGPLLYMRISVYFKSTSIITAGYIAASISGLAISIVGSLSPWVFALSLLPATLAGSITRPPTTNLLLEQQKSDTGAAVSLMTCAFTVFGSIGMAIISLSWANRITVMGLLYFIIGILSLSLWLFISKQPFVKHVNNYDE